MKNVSADCPRRTFRPERCQGAYSPRIFSFPVVNEDARFFDKERRRVRCPDCGVAESALVEIEACIQGITRATQTVTEAESMRIAEPTVERLSIPSSAGTTFFEGRKVVSSQEIVRCLTSQASQVRKV
jgi:hypothetical protein